MKTNSIAYFTFNDYDVIYGKFFIKLIFAKVSQKMDVEEKKN